MQRYNPKEIEPKWQQQWQEDGIYNVTEDPSKPKSYVTAMFPYPSGAGLHVGHVRNYSITDAIARFERQKGKNVLSTIGWDAFGLPAENYAIKTGTPPAVSTAQNIKNFKAQLSRLGMSYDWSREVNTTDPGYYKWTQWIFTKLFERGLAYQAERMQWWCNECKTVLANEQVINGCCWRHETTPVVKKSLKQWFFKITDYADQLLEGTNDLEWPEKIKTMQKNWIGRSVGAEITFAVDGAEQTLTVFTTRPDTLYGATFAVLAPEHPQLEALVSDEQRAAVLQYRDEAVKKSDVERQLTDREKTGVFTGAHLVNPVNGAKIPLWVADYVLTGYGTGAIMAVPAHDERDGEFAAKFNIPTVQVVAQDFGTPLPDAKDVEGVNVIGYDPATKQFMSLHNNNTDQAWLASGGRNDGESFEAAARRELAEEAGYHDVKQLIPLGGLHYSYYYNDNKKSNRRAQGMNYLAIIAEAETTNASNESHEDYNVVWTGSNELKAAIAKTGGGVEHWLDAIEKAEAAAAAYDNGATYQAPAYHGEGVMVNSGEYSGMSSQQAREKIVADLAAKGVAEERVNYRMRDWLISRQRYWGAPIPIVHCATHGAVAVPESQLPVVLPEVSSFEPTGDGKGVLGQNEEWLHTTCPTCGEPALRETDTMDGYACSSWYFLRYTDAQNAEQAWDPAHANYWLPIDYYCGGDHAVSHLLYSRFWMYVFADMGLIEHTRKEPVKRLVYNGYINAADGTKMSKSKGNVVDPLELIDAGYGADALRVYELFIAPYELDAAWDPGGIAGAYRFLNRVWTLVQELEAADVTEDTAAERAIATATHKAIKKVSDDLNRLSFNTAIAAMMELVNDLYKIKAEHGYAAGGAWQQSLTQLVQLLAPFAPHIAEELWEQLGNESSVHTSKWPEYDEQYLVTDTVTVAVQVSGKVRGQVVVAKDADEGTVLTAAHAEPRVAAHLDGKQVVKTIYVPGRILNIVAQ